MDKFEFEIGDKVEVVEHGEVYPNYDDLAAHMQLSHWECGRGAADGIVCIVVARALFNITQGRPTYGIRVIGQDMEFLIDRPGIELYAGSCNPEEEEEYDG